MAQKKAEQARPPQATRTLSPWALLRHQHIPGPTAGQAPWGRWLPPIATGRLACAGGCGAGTIRRAELSWASQGLAAVWGEGAGTRPGANTPAWGHRATGRGCWVRWCHAPSLPGPAASAALSQGPPGVAASGSQGGTRVRGGGQSLGGPGPRRGLQPPNTALEATGHSVRFVAGVGLYRVARASAWTLGTHQKTRVHSL